MDTTSSLIPKSKMTKLNEKDDAHGSDRSLNDLPDAILKHILSYLEMKCAVRTSVLCKRWEYMWTSIPNLKFTEVNEFEREGDESVDRDHFMDFVDRVLIFHDAPRIQKFVLWCKAMNDTARIKTWISFAVKHDAREFDICLGSMYDQQLFPHCLFSCQSMEVLELHGCCGLLLPSQICLPRLKVLTIGNFTLKDCHSTNLLFASPALEELVLTNCKWEGSGNEFIISSPKLYRLTIRECDEPYSSVELSSISITISSPELQNFYYTGGFVKAYHFNHPSSIFWEAVLDFHSFMKVEEMCMDHFDEVLKSIKFVENLLISSSFVQALSRATVPVLKNLTIMELTGDPIDISCKGLEIILDKCPRLESLLFPSGISNNYDVEHLLNSDFKCLSTVKYISFLECEGTMKELFAVQILLAKARVLEVMTIDNLKANGSARDEMKTFISAMPRASKSCKLSIYFCNEA